MVAYFESNKTGIRPIRAARAQVILVESPPENVLKEFIIDLDSKTVIEELCLHGKHSFIDAEYMKAVEKACLANKQIQQEIEKLQLPPGSTICVEPWAYATDGMNDMSERITMVSVRFYSSEETEDSLTSHICIVLVLPTDLRQP